MKVYAKRILIALLIVITYFTVWKSIRGFVTSELVIPQIEYAITNCDETIAFDRSKSTSLTIHLLDKEANKYETYAYISPGGFYLLFGLVFIVLLGGNRFYYYSLIGFHVLFLLFSTATIVPGLCYQSLFIHTTFAGIKYVTKFVTFFILILLVSPNLKKRFDISE